MKNKCDKSWHTGECCCNCKNQIELFKHPWNQINKGSVKESTNMFACIPKLDLKSANKGIVFENKHGMCELHELKFNKK